ncbi:ESF1 homolog isoform X2 [Chelonus insularis]|nr:ESF1 homolog isoform X2 [Chelonus insularis]XP_034941542.1 ESF1 homolog isoform X2 [Chelonus insularis]XP_034941543.1 ESF1 homolog isoform X2 [Chelonus insularis]
MDEILKDPRFAHVPKDPKFRKIPKNERKVKIDKRFQSMFKDEKFTVKYTIDKRGRPISQTSTENLKKYYDLSSNEDDSDEDEIKQNEKIRTSKKTKKNKITNSSKQKTKPKDKNITDDDDSDSDETNKNIHIGEDDIRNDLDESHTSSDCKSISTALELNENEKQLNLRRKNEQSTINPNIKKKLKDLTIDYARGEGTLFSDSSSDEESSEDENDEDIEHNWGELDKDADTTEEVTSRLAVCNMDWDRIRAVDLMVLLNSFLPPGGLIHSVTIYPSEYGLKRMKEEEIKGPIELVDNKTEEESDNDTHSNDHDENNSENEEGSQFHREKMRQYQLNRLKYYYAVVAFDSEESANKVYTECDGIEYESTATKLDLRFIPNDMEFDHEPKEVCSKLPEVTKYQPRSFTTTALQQVKVELTWDETKPERKEITQKLNSGKIDDVDDSDIQAYLASGTSDESDVDEIDVHEKSEANSNVQVKEHSDPIEKYKSLLKSIEEKEEEKKKKEVELEFTWGLGIKEKTEKLVKERMKKKENLTPFEQFLEKRKEKKKAKLEEKKKTKQSDINGESSNEEESDSEDSIPSDVDMNDPYFAEEMKNMKQKNKKIKSKKINHDSDDEEKIQKKSELELLMLDEDDGKHHFDMNKIEENQMLTKSKKKRLSKKKKKQVKEVVEDNFEVNVNDPRFSALFYSHYFNVDPADPHYRKTKGTEALINEKFKRRANQNEDKDLPTKQLKKDEATKDDIAALVKMVKKNTKNILKPIK